MGQDRQISRGMRQPVQMLDRPKVFIVDDSLIFRAMLETTVSRDPAFEIVGLAASADDALAEIGWLLPDIVLLDLNFRTGMDGLRCVEEIASHWHEMRVIVVSIDARHGSDVCREAFRRGAAACFDKAEVMRSSRELIALMHDLVEDHPPAHGRFSRAITLPSIRT
jgi:two-component system chemotaxis response regulator CheB